jgi:hypothetical protein
MNSLCISQVSVALSSALLVFEFLLGISETFLCSVSVLIVTIVLPLDALQLLMLCVGT